MAKRLAREDWKTAQTAIANLLLAHDVYIVEEKPLGSNRIDIFLASYKKDVGRFPEGRRWTEISKRRW